MSIEENETLEIDLKQAIFHFIKENFEVEGDPVLVREKIIDLTNNLFDIIQYHINKRIG